ncbi:hypothetical protein HAX54_043129 [Datura stramonium]|uniref:Uncharacterized protein n=1 Tax=Datura stramonium TaxID=4076 RepID=A0ABS8W1Y4_DATST|nr:hypothetical protein [Datura stramonium]
MEKIQSQQSEDGSQSSVHTFAAVMGPENPGCVLLYGRGVTKSTLNGKGHSEPSSSATDETVQPVNWPFAGSNNQGGENRQGDVEKIEDLT